MVWLEDPLTGDMPHRGIVEEEDEQRAQELAAQYTVPPEVQWVEGVTGANDPIVVFLVGQAACLLSSAFFQNAQQVGSITVPELVRVKSPLEEEFGTPNQPLHTSLVSALPSSSGGRNSSPILVVGCKRDLPAEQAVSWARHVLAVLQPCGAVVAATLPAMSYRGPGSPADEDLMFSLRTEAAQVAAQGSEEAGNSTSTLPPPLPEATLLAGLPAALLSLCELQQLPAVLVTGVQMHQVADAQFLYHLGEAAAGALRNLGGEAAAAALARQQPRAQLLAALSAAADKVYRSSASSSIFS